MANIKSQIKRNLQNERARLRNKAIKSELRTRIKVAVGDAETGAKDAESSFRAAVKRLDQAVSKGVIHKNQAANRKSALAKRLNAPAKKA